MKDNAMILQDNLNTVVSGVQALSLLSKMIQRNDNGKLIEKDDVTKILRQLSEALVSTQKNDLDTSCHFTKNPTDQDVLSHNIRCSIDGNDVDTDDDVPMASDTESCESDTQSEPDIDYQEELRSRMMYYGAYDTIEEQTPASKKIPVATSSSTPLTSSTMIEECTDSMIRNNNRRRNRSTPLASSTMMEDLLADVEVQTENGSSIVTWSIDDNTASVKEYYRRRFEMSNCKSSDSDGEPSNPFWMPTNVDLSTIFNSDDSFDTSLDSDMSTKDFFNSNNKFPRTSTSSDLLKNTTEKYKDTDKDQKKKKSTSKQPISRLLYVIRNIKRNLSKKRSSK